MANFDLSSYVEVNVRVEKFWKENPNGAIRTEIVSFENGTIVMKASVYKAGENEMPDATGHAYEKEGSTYINKTSAIENCETSAVGRALGIMGFEIKKAIASKEEVANAIHQQKTIDADTKLKQDLVAKHKGNKTKAKAEYDKIVADRNKPQQETLDDDATKYLEEKFDLKESA